MGLNSCHELMSQCESLSSHVWGARHYTRSLLHSILYFYSMCYSWCGIECTYSHTLYHGLRSPQWPPFCRESSLHILRRVWSNPLGLMSRTYMASWWRLWYCLLFYCCISLHWPMNFVSTCVFSDTGIIYSRDSIITDFQQCLFHHCRVLAVSLIHTLYHGHIGLNLHGSMDFVNFLCELYLYFTFSLELWALIEGPTPSLIDIAVYRTYWYCRRLSEIHWVSLLFTHCHMVLMNPTFHCTASLKYNVYSGQILSWCDLWSGTGISDLSIHISGQMDRTLSGGYRI